VQVQGSFKQKPVFAFFKIASFYFLLIFRVRTKTSQISLFKMTIQCLLTHKYVHITFFLSAVPKTVNQREQELVKKTLCFLLSLKLDPPPGSLIQEIPNFYVERRR
jgi:hypothetical protein